MGYEWKVGELAVCVDGGKLLFDDMWLYVTTGHIYTISDYGPETETQLAWVRLYGFPTSQCEEGGFRADRFRPLNEDDYKRIREKHGQDIEVGNWGALFEQMGRRR